MASLVVRRLDTGEEVHRVTLSRTDEGYVTKVLRGMLRNMNTDAFFVSEEA